MDYKYKESVLEQKSYYSTLEQIFARRGIAPNEIEHYLATTDDDICPVDTIDYLLDGCKILIKHISANDKILIIIDCDVDGYTSAALLLNYLNKICPSTIQNNIDYWVHDGKQHGIEDSYVNEVIKHGYKLLICPDSSSNDYDQHQKLYNNGVDVLIIDHHEADKISSYACVINNQLCNYPTKSLSGVGMVYKFCTYLDQMFNFNYADDFLDLVSIGMIADMMSLRDLETKHLIFKGLENIKNPFLKEIERMQSFSINRAGGLNPFSVSFYIAPLINATIRMGTQEEKLLLFEAMLDFKGYAQILSTKRGFKGQYETVVEQACRNCNNIKNKQTKARDAGLEIIQQIIEDKHLQENKIIAVKLKPELNIDKNITGLIANILVSKYQHPVLLLNRITTEDGQIGWSGSARGYVTAQLTDLKKFIQSSGYAFLAEGHPNAFGVGILDSNFEDFINYSNDVLKDCNFTPCYNVDFIWDAIQTRPKDILDIAELNNIWGQDVEKPLIVCERVPITQSNITLMSPDKSPTIKITLSNGISFIKFKASQEELESIEPDTPYGKVYLNIVGTCNENEWNGHITPQIQVEAYEICSKL